MPARTTRPRLLAAATLTALAALSLTACGTDDNDTNASTTGTAQTTSNSSTPHQDENTSSTGNLSPDHQGTRTADTPHANTANSSEEDSDTSLAPCTSEDLTITATEVSSPVNHLLLTATNTSTEDCTLPGYPQLRFDQAQSVPPVIEDSQPQAVVTLAPGESAYAGVTLSAADGSGTHGYTATTLEVHLTDNTGTLTPALPDNGVYIDDTLTVTYWQQNLNDALTW